MNLQNEVENNLKNVFSDYNSEKFFVDTFAEQLHKLIGLVGESPVKFVEFYSEKQPNEMPNMKSYATLYCIDRIIEENTELAPGAYLAKLGIFVFAVTSGGNVICIDINDMNNGDPTVLLIDQSFCCGEEDDIDSEVEIVNLPSYIDEDDYSDEDFEFNYENVRKFVYKIEDSFTEFVRKYSLNQYDDLEKKL